MEDDQDKIVKEQNNDESEIIQDDFEDDIIQTAVDLSPNHEQNESKKKEQQKITKKLDKFQSVITNRKRLKLSEDNKNVQANKSDPQETIKINLNLCGGKQNQQNKKPANNETNSNNNANKKGLLLNFTNPNPSTQYRVIPQSQQSQAKLIQVNNNYHLMKNASQILQPNTKSQQGKYSQPLQAKEDSNSIDSQDATTTESYEDKIKRVKEQNSQQIQKSEQSLIIRQNRAGKMIIKKISPPKVDSRQIVTSQYLYNQLYWQNLLKQTDYDRLGNRIEPAQKQGSFPIGSVNFPLVYDKDKPKQVNEEKSNQVNNELPNQVNKEKLKPINKDKPVQTYESSDDSFLSNFSKGDCSTTQKTSPSYEGYDLFQVVEEQERQKFYKNLYPSQSLKQQIEEQNQLKEATQRQLKLFKKSKAIREQLYPEEQPRVRHINPNFLSQYYN
eukprot:403352458